MTLADPTRKIFKFRKCLMYRLKVAILISLVRYFSNATHSFSTSDLSAKTYDKSQTVSRVQLEDVRGVKWMVTEL